MEFWQKNTYDMMSDNISSPISIIWNTFFLQSATTKNMMNVLYIQGQRALAKCEFCTVCITASHNCSTNVSSTAVLGFLVMLHSEEQPFEQLTRSVGYVLTFISYSAEMASGSAATKCQMKMTRGHPTGFYLFPDCGQEWSILWLFKKRQT